MSNEFKQRTRYETEQIAEIQKWKNEEPGVISQSFGLLIEPMSWMVQKIIPEASIQGALECANSAAQFLADKNDIIKDARVTNIEDLKYRELQLSDRLADNVHNWAIAAGVAEGTTEGILGLPGMVVGIPATITLALRTIHKIGICYGYEASTEEDNKFVLGILAASGANSVEEKSVALLYLKSIETMLIKQTWKQMQEIAATGMGKEAAIFTIKNIAKQLGINLTKRKALAAIPFIGATIGGSANGWYLKEVGWAARRAFQERWLVDNQKIIDID